MVRRKPSKIATSRKDPLALAPAQTAFLHALSDKMRNKMVALKREGDAELRRLVEADGRGGDPL